MYAGLDYGRRSFLAYAAKSLAFGPLIATKPFAFFNNVDQKVMNTTGKSTNSLFGHTKQIDAGVLNVGYIDDGPSNGPVVILLHGWPYDIHSYVDVIPLLTSKGYRTIVPHLRGYGTTRFLSTETFRNGQPSALAIDIIDLMDALHIENAIIAGFDWGARTANIVGALWPERCKAMVSVSGYLIGSQASGKIPLPPSAELQW
jgi:pimeloyl-ACP methyl ester carboxylesterase